MADIDNLEIKIGANAKTASNAIDNLCNKLGRLSASLGSVNTGSITGMANGVNRLASAMTNMKSVGTADFTRAAKGIEKMSAVDTAALNRAASSIGQIGKSLNTLSGMGAASKNLSDLAKGIAQLGYKSSTQAIQNIPKLATAMKQLMTELSKAPRVSQNLIDMTNALAKLSRTGSSAGKAANSLKSSLTSYSGSVKSSKLSTFSLASAIGKLYASYWMVIRAAGKLKDAVNLASDLTEVQNVVDTTFGAMTGKVEEYAKKSIETLGMSELSFKTYASQFQAMGSAMGIGTSQIAKANDFLQKTTDGYVGASDSLADVSLNLTKLAGDMASFYNKDQAEVAEDLRSVFTGMVVPLRQYGLDLTQATLKEWAMKNGMDADIESMSQAEKTMLRYQYVLANTTAAQGDFSRTADTWANQVRMLQENFKRLGAVIGQPIINALKPMVKALNAALMAVTQFAEKVSAALGKIFGWQYEAGSAGIAVDLGDASDSAGSLADSTDDASKNTNKANSAAKKLKKTLSTLPFDQLNKLADNTDSSGSGSGGSGGGKGSGGSGSGGTGGGSTGGNQGTWKRVSTMFESNIDTLYGLGKYIGDTLSKAMESIDWNRIYEKAKDFGRGLADFLNGLISPRLFGNVGKTIASSLNTVIYSALSFGIRFDWKNLGNSIATGVNTFFKTFDFNSLARTINVWANGLLDTVITMLDRTNWTMIGTRIGKFLSDIDFVKIGKKAGKALWKAINAGVKIFSSSFNNAPIETTIASFVLMPKLLKAIASTKIISGMTNLSKSFKKVYDNLILVVGALRGNKDNTDKLSKSYPKLGKSVDVVRKSFQNFRVGIENGNFFNGLSEGAKTLRNHMTNLQKGVVGATSVFAQFALSTSAFHDLASGADNVGASIAKIASGAAIAAVALKTLGLSNPFTALIVGTTALVSAIVGVNQAMNELLDKNVGEYIKESFSTPGGVPVEKLFSSAKSAINSVGDSFNSVSEKIRDFENSKESVKNVIVEIEKIQDAMKIGVTSTEDGVKKLSEQFDSLYDAAKLNLDAYQTLMYSTFSDGSVASKAFESAGTDIEKIKEQVTGFSSETQEKIRQLIDKMKELSKTDPTNPQLKELQSELFNLMGQSDDTTKAMDEFETYINSTNLDWSAYINEDGLNVDAVNDDLSSLVGSVKDAQDKTEEALINLANSAKEAGDTKTYQAIMDGLPGAMEYVKEQTTTKAQDIANKLQTEYVKNIGSIITKAGDDWEDLDPLKKASYQWSKGTYILDVVGKYKEKTIDPLDKTISENFEQLGIDGAGYASSAADNIIDSLFTTTSTASSTGGVSVYTDVYGDYKELFEKLGDDASVVAGEAGKDTIAGYQKGLNDNDVDLEKEATDGPFSKFVNAVKKFLGIHSPSTVFAEIGGFTMSGFLNGLNSNSGKVLEWFSKLPGNIKDKLGDAKEWIKDKGKNALEGLKNGWDSVKESKVGQTVQKIGGYVKDKAGNAGQWIKSKGSDAINGLRAGWDSVKQSGFLNTVGQIGGQVYKGIGNLRDKVKGKGTDIINGLKNGFDSNSWRFYNSFSGIGNRISNSIGDMWGLGHRITKNFANGLSSVGIKLPHISWTSRSVGFGKFSFSVPSFKVNWYKKGGVFDEASMIGVGEAGKEAVLPLENKKTMSMIAESITKNSSGLGISEEQLEDAVARGVAMAMINNKQDINVQCVAEFKTTDEALARAVSRGQQKIEYRMKPVPSY